MHKICLKTVQHKFQWATSEIIKWFRQGYSFFFLEQAMTDRLGVRTWGRGGRGRGSPYLNSECLVINQAVNQFCYPLGLLLQYWEENEQTSNKKNTIAYISYSGNHEYWEGTNKNKYVNPRKIRSETLIFSKNTEKIRTLTSNLGIPFYHKLLVLHI